MAGKFHLKKFAEIDLADPFFDELKADYPGTLHSTGFTEWFGTKAAESATALVFDDDDGVGAFVYLKDENEPVELTDGLLPAVPRMKIGTLRIAERYRGQRLGEGAIGLAIWKWQKSASEEMYVTVFDKHELLIELFERFGFRFAGNNPNGERVYVKSRGAADYSDPYEAFPFIDPGFENAGYLVVDDQYHDTLFPYSELKNTLQESVALSVANGLSKVYIGSPTSPVPFRRGEPILIYRRYTGTDGGRGFKSCITSFCVVTDVIVAKENWKPQIPIDEVLARVRNKTVFSEQEIRTRFKDKGSLVVVEMLYYGYFGAGNNVNWMWLKDHGLWPEGYPTTARLSREEFATILREGEVDVSTVIVD